MLNKIEKAWQNWIKTAFEFKAINDNEVQVLTPFTDAFDDGIIMFCLIAMFNNCTRD